MIGHPTGRYNDTSGTAYLLLYDSRERIKTFYVGSFQDGYFHDQSGNAIDILNYFLLVIYMIVMAIHIAAKEKTTLY